MNSKQKYKVFINDQPVVFVSDAAECSSECIISRDLSDITALKPLQRLCIVADDPKSAWKKFITSHETIVAAGGIVWMDHPGDRLLMIFRLGKWDLPKGKLDSGESTEQAALREVEEECGIKGMKIVRRLEDTWHMYRHKGRWKLKQSCWYEMQYEGDGILSAQASEGIEKAEWVRPSELAFLLPDAYASIRELLESVVKLK